MKIYLFMDHTAYLVDDKKPTVTVEPACGGVLEVEGRRYAVAASGASVIRPLHDLVGQVRVTFTTEGGDRYTGVRPYMAEGIPCSRVDYAAEYAGVRIHLDEMERQVEKLTAAYHALSAETKHDALGFLTHNTKKREVQ